MPFYQNPFESEFRQSMPFADRQYNITWKVPANRNNNQATIAWNFEPYDFSTHANLTISYAIDKDFKNYASMTINVAGATPSATYAAEVAADLNADAGFADRFIASVTTNGNNKRVLIRAKSDRQAIRFYFANTSAERILKFNRHAGVAELPSYCSRHTIENRFEFTDSLAHLIELDEGDAVDQAIITEAGFDYTDMQEDWELLQGRAEIFTFKKQTVDGSSRITEIIEYPAGARVGDLAIKTQMSYTGAKTQPDKITEIPYVLQSGDLVTP